MNLLSSSVLVQIYQMQVPLKAYLALNPCSVLMSMHRTWLDVMLQRTSASANEDSSCKMVSVLVSMWAFYYLQSTLQSFPKTHQMLLPLFVSILLSDDS